MRYGQFSTTGNQSSYINVFKKEFEITIKMYEKKETGNTHYNRDELYERFLSQLKRALMAARSANLTSMTFTGYNEENIFRVLFEEYKKIA